MSGGVDDPGREGWLGGETGEGAVPGSGVAGGRVVSGLGVVGESPSSPAVHMRDESKGKH